MVRLSLLCVNQKHRYIGSSVQVTLITITDLDQMEIVFPLPIFDLFTDERLLFQGCGHTIQIAEHVIQSGEDKADV